MTQCGCDTVLKLGPTDDRFEVDGLLVCEPCFDVALAAANSLPDFNSCDYHAGHRCRRCQVHITDMEYIAAGLFFSLCPTCLASARQTVKEMSA